MLNFYGYHIQKMHFIRGFIDFSIIFGGLFLYSFFGLASSGSSTPIEVSPFVLSLTTSIVTWGVLFALGTYDIPKKDLLKNLIARLIAACLVIIPLSLLLWWGAGFEYKNSLYVPVVAIFIQLSLFFLVRFLFEVIVKQKDIYQNIIVISNQSDASDVLHIIKESAAPYRVIRVIPPEFLDKHKKFNLLALCRRKDATMVVIGREKTPAQLHMFASCRFANIRIMDVDLLRERLLGKVNIEKLYSYYLIFDHHFSLGHIVGYIKRLFDIFVAIFILILTLPVTVFVLIAVFLTDRHNPFYTQIRVGRGGKKFNVFKFRSMRIDAEKGGAVWAREKDNRVTRIGRFIRKTRIDEIPQCFNVLMGDMSIVGPRPERPEFVSMLEEQIYFYSERHHVRPGLTGWAQINEHYGGSVEGARRKLEYDLYYLKHHNIVLDILILMKTISVVIWPNGVR